MHVKLNNLQHILVKASRYNDIVLATLVVAIIALMILPMPTPLLDGLIAANLGLAVTLIMVAMYIPSALSLSTFPSILLFTTLFRLSLNITSTRLILLNADAGEIISTFGNFVVAGNFVVGGAIFLIITIVQFLVIAKGSERVAEVSARFTLDAMPGKQMSIDADLRAGVIDMADARRRRRGVERESQLYGAMDGAMKFVKGDAIAGIIIIVVNILGGMAIGVLQKGMDLGRAVQTYSILTIGDGLVSQIPALFISVTAGIIVTRVSSGTSDSLGGEIGSQLLGQPKALLLGGVLLCCFAMVPGFPKWQFITLGLLIGFVGFVFRLVPSGPLQKAEFEDDGVSGAEDEIEERTGRVATFSLTTPLSVAVASSLRTMIQSQALQGKLKEVRRALYLDLGVPFPDIALRFSHTIEKDRYVVLLHEIPVSEGVLLSGRLLVRETEEHLRVLGIACEAGKTFLPDMPNIWVEEGLSSRLDQAGVAWMDPVGVLTYHVMLVLKRYASEFMGLQETRYLMERMEERFPELVRESQRILPLPKITEVLQRLVQEGLSIRNLRSILQSLIEWGQKEKDVILLTEYVRMSLNRYISYKYSMGQNLLAVYLFDADTEETIRKAIRQTSAGSYLALDPRAARALVDAIKAEVGDIGRRVQKPVLLVSMDIRRYVKKMVELDLPDLPVLSHQELTQEIIVQPLGRITLPAQ